MKTDYGFRLSSVTVLTFAHLNNNSSQLHSRGQCFGFRMGCFVAMMKGQSSGVGVPPIATMDLCGKRGISLQLYRDKFPLSKTVSLLPQLFWKVTKREVLRRKLLFVLSGAQKKNTSRRTTSVKICCLQREETVLYRFPQSHCSGILPFFWHAFSRSSSMRTHPLPHLSQLLVLFINAR